NAYLTRSGFTLQRVQLVGDPKARLADQLEAEPRNAKITVLEFSFEDSSPDVRLEGLEPLATPTFMFGGQWRGPVQVYGAVRYHELYPGIDLDVYLHDGHVEYDLLLKPGANPADIVVKLSGADRLRAGEDGSIIAETPLGDLRQQIPATYQRSSTGE